MLVHQRVINLDSGKPLEIIEPVEPTSIITSTSGVFQGLDLATKFEYVPNSIQQRGTPTTLWFKKNQAISNSNDASRPLPSQSGTAASLPHFHRIHPTLVRPGFPLSWRSLISPSTYHLG
jgi:hypothetical protein